jgi:hypothetical protein
MLTILAEGGMRPQARRAEGCESDGGCEQPGKKAGKNGHPVPLARIRDGLLPRRDQITV